MEKFINGCFVYCARGRAAAMPDEYKAGPGIFTPFAPRLISAPADKAQ